MAAVEPPAPPLYAGSLEGGSLRQRLLDSLFYGVTAVADLSLQQILAGLGDANHAPRFVES